MNCKVDSDGRPVFLGELLADEPLNQSRLANTLIAHNDELDKVSYIESRNQFKGDIMVPLMLNTVVALWCCHVLK